VRSPVDIDACWCLSAGLTAYKKWLVIYGGLASRLVCCLSAIRS